MCDEKTGNNPITLEYDLCGVQAVDGRRQWEAVHVGFGHNMGFGQAGGLTLQKLLSHRSQSRRSEVKVPAESGSESSLPGWQVLPVPSRGLPSGRA